MKKPAKPPYRPNLTSPLPALPTLDEVRRKLDTVFPEAFPNRGLLVGQMAARAIYVFLYGGFAEGSDRRLRPSYILFFTEEQAHKTSDEERIDWIRNSVKPGYRPAGTRWYASDNTRESIRDDLIRNRLIPLSIVDKQAEYDTTSSVPIYFLLPEFAALFDPNLSGEAFFSAAEAWRRRNLNEATIQRMSLKAKGIHAKAGDLFIDMPDGTRIRLSGGISNLIVKGLIEDFAKEHLTSPAVLWVSGSDEKAHPAFVQIAKAVGLEFNLSNELPDVILADLKEPIRIIMCEVVATDGAITEVRKKALLGFARSSKIPEECFEFLSAFEEREAAAFKKNFSQLALGTSVWFRTEPKLLVVLKTSEDASLLET